MTRTIHLTNGQSITGRVVHMNPNYWYIVSSEGHEFTIPVWMIK